MSVRDDFMYKREFVDVIYSCTYFILLDKEGAT